MYNVLHHNRAEDMWAGKHTLCSNNYIQQNWLHNKITRTTTSINYDYVQFKKWETTTFYFNFVEMRPNIIQKILPHAHRSPLNPRTNLHTKIIPHTHLNKHHNKTLDNCKNIHTNILPHTQLNEIPPDAHHAPLHNRTIIHTKLFIHCNFNPTR